MNFDNNDGTTGTGTFTMSDFQLIGNGRHIVFEFIHLCFIFDFMYFVDILY